MMGAMKVIALLPLMLVLALPAQAQDAGRDGGDPSQVTLPAPPVDPAVRAARELDRLFGALRQAEDANAKQIEEKIWANWQVNPSPTAELLLRQARLAMSDGELATSEEMLNELVGTYPDYAEALNRRAALYFKMKRYDEALADITSVLDMEPRHFGAMALRGAIYAAQGNIDGAKLALEEALSINPHQDDVKAALTQLTHDYPDI